MVRNPRKSVVPKDRKPQKERELFHVSRDEEKGGERKSIRRGKYEMVKVTADSGAADHVAPVQTANHLEVRETEAYRQGAKYVAANGHTFKNLGQRKIQGVTDTGVPLGMAWQVAAVKKPLASVGRMCDAGNVAVFTKDGGYVVPGEYMEELIGTLERMGQATLRTIRDNRVYNFNLWVPTPP